MGHFALNQNHFRPQGVSRDDLLVLSNRDIPAKTIYQRLRDPLSKRGETNRTLVIVSHLETSTLETALDVESLVGLGTIQDALCGLSACVIKKGETAETMTYLVAPDLACNIIQRLNHSQAQLLPLLALFDRNIFNMAHHTQGTDELALNDQATGSHNPIAAITDHNEEVLPVALLHPVVPLVPLLNGKLANASEYAENVKVSGVII